MAELRSVVASAPLDLKEVFLRGRWTEVLILTYSFDLPFFEAYVLPLLVSGGCRAITVAACAEWLPERLRGWSEAGDIHEAGRSYTLSMASVPGVFHPKLVLAASERRGVVLVGSGNISEYGMTMGGELFTLMEWNDIVPALAREAWQLCREVVRRLPVERSFSEGVEAFGRLVPAITAPSTEGMLVHNLGSPILDQFVQQLANHPVDELVVWSPFTDRNLHALDTLVDRVQPSRVLVGVQPGLTSLNGARLEALAAQRRHIVWDVRALGQRRTTRPRLIHAKGILATLRSGEQLALLGSPNLSSSALLRTVSTGNFELAVLHRGRTLREQLFGEDSLITLGDVVAAEHLSWLDDPSTTDQPSPRPSVQLLGARQNGEWLALEILGTPPSDARILLDDAMSLPVVASKDGPGAALSDALAARTAELIWDEGRSGPVIVADLARLAAMYRGSEPRQHAPLEALDYGADSDIIALLDQLAQLAIGSVYDLDRMLRGRDAPTPQEEAEEAAGNAPLVRLEDIDFDAVRQHPRAHAYSAGVGGSLDAPRIELWLDEIVQQFQWLRERQLRRVVLPVVSDEDELPTDSDPEERRPSFVSRRTAERVRNRLRRYVIGIGDPRFWPLVDPEWMAANYVLFLSLLERLWVRAATPEAILSGDDLGPLTLELLSGYWGDDRRAGYVSKLSEEARWLSAVLITDRHGDALTAAACIRLLDAEGHVGRCAPFVVGAYVQVAQELGLITEKVLDRALVFLDRREDEPNAQLERLLATLSHFTWDRFATNLGWRYGFRSVALLPRAPGLGRFISGDVLVVDGEEDLPMSDATLRIFAEWVAELRKRDPARAVIQMVWGKGLILVYDLETREVLTRHSAAGGGGETRTIATHVSPEQIQTLASAGGLPNSA